MSRWLNSLFVAVPLALVAGSIGCGSTVLGGGGVEDEDGPGLCSVMDGGVLRTVQCSPVEDGVEDGEDGDDCSTDCEDCPCEPPPPPPELRSLVIERDGLALLQFASFGLSCSEESPSLPDCRAQEDYLLEVEMPASYLVAGNVVDFGDPEVFMFTQVRGGAEADGQCVSGGGGSGFGSMTIHAVGAGSVSVTVSGAIMTFEDMGSDVDFDVLRCSPAPQPGSHALGHFIEMGWDQPSDDNFTTTYQAGGEPQEDRFVVQIANHDAATCDNPYASPACPFEARSFSVSIPVSALEVGNVIDLSDPAIFVSFSEQGLNEGSDDCWFAGGGGPEPGTMTIGQAGQGTLDVTFEGTTSALANGTHTIDVCDR